MPGKKQSSDKNGKDKQAQDKHAPDKRAQAKNAPAKHAPDQHAHDKPPLTEDEIKAIAERRAESLKRIQEQNAKNATKHFGDDNRGGGGKGKGGPSKGRMFRHQGR